MEANSEPLCSEAIKRILQILGGKWSFLVVGELYDGARRFNDLCRRLNVSTKALSDTLKNLESNGIVTRLVHPTTPVTVEYVLTEKGRDLEQVFFAMKSWGLKWLDWMV